MKDELAGKIMKEFVELKRITYSYLTDDNDKSETAKDTKKCAIKRKLTFEDYENYLQASELENEIIYLNNNKTDVRSLVENYKRIYIKQ